MRGGKSCGQTRRLVRSSPSSCTRAVALLNPILPLSSSSHCILPLSLSLSSTLRSDNTTYYQQLVRRTVHTRLRTHPPVCSLSSFVSSLSPPIRRTDLPATWRETRHVVLMASILEQRNSHPRRRSTTSSHAAWVFWATRSFSPRLIKTNVSRRLLPVWKRRWLLWSDKGG